MVKLDTQERKKLLTVFGLYLHKARQLPDNPNSSLVFPHVWNNGQPYSPAREEETLGRELRLGPLNCAIRA